MRKEERRETFRLLLCTARIFALVSPSARAWTTWNYAALWIGMAVCIPTYMLAGSMVIISMIGLTIATLSTNIAANVVASANDIANIAPNKISFKMGAIRELRLWTASRSFIARQRLPFTNALTMEGLRRQEKRLLYEAATQIEGR